MKIKKKNVYYCDYCKKKSLRTLIEHEKHCTGNINRSCRMCECVNDYKFIIFKLKNRYEIMKYEYGDFIRWIGEPITMQEIWDEVDGCPACALTVIRNIDSVYMDLDFNYKKEVAKMWKEQNASRASLENY